MIELKTARELERMKKACRLSAQALEIAQSVIAPGVTTAYVDRKIREFITSQGARPTFLNYGGFPGSACVSVNEELIHGIPSEHKVLKEGDIVSVDVGAYYRGYHGDNAFTFPCGKISAEAQALLDATRESLYEGINQAQAQNRIGDIGSAVQEYVEARSYSVVRNYVGHGVGTKLHEDPSVPNYGTKGRGVKLLPGMTIAIEPMINEGTHHTRVLGDKWTVVTADGKLSAHFEHTVAITPDGPRILTVCD